MGHFHNDKPYKCNYIDDCNAAFTKHPHLNYHIRYKHVLNMARKVKTLNCEYCDKSFRSTTDTKNRPVTSINGTVHGDIF